jgi:2-methylcitrate dehydratase PrpD
LSAVDIETALAQLVAFASNTEWTDLPELVQKRAALVLCDDLAAIVAARAEPEIVALHDGISKSAGQPEAMVFNGRGQKFDRYSSALANGCAGNWVELDEGYRRVICHAGIYCLPALLAEAESERNSTQDLLRALVLGYEIVARVARAFTFSKLVLHPHGSLAAVGAAAAIASLRRVPEDVAIAAISSSATMVSPGPYTHPIKGSLVRNVWPGIAAQTGLRAVDWSEIGIRGLSSALHDVYTDAFGADADSAQLCSNLGDDWAISDGYHKVFACCQYGHATIEATLKLLQQAPFERVVAIHLETHEKARLMNNPDPNTTIAAKFSIQHIASTAAVYGGGGAEAFSSKSLHNPAIAELRHKVSTSLYEPMPDWPNDRPTRVIWTLDDGTTLSEEVMSARGGPDLPFTPDEIRVKVHAIVDDPYPAMGRALDSLLDLEAYTLSQPWDETVRGMTL